MAKMKVPFKMRDGLRFCKLKKTHARREGVRRRNVCYNMRNSNLWCRLPEYITLSCMLFTVYTQCTRSSSQRRKASTLFFTRFIDFAWQKDHHHASTSISNRCACYAHDINAHVWTAEYCLVFLVFLGYDMLWSQWEARDFVYNYM